MGYRALRCLLSAGVLAVLSACAGTPASLAPLPEPIPDLQQVVADPAAMKGDTVVWGGVIAELENTTTGTRLEVVSRPLDRQGRPRALDDSRGRFRAHSGDFLDPQIYREGREVTVRGAIHGIEEGTIGDYAYTFPVLQADAVYLWPRRTAPDPLRHDPFYDPFFGPWGPRPGWPYHAHPWYW